MTREEAIKRLKEVRTTIQPYQYVDEAIDYAIEALKERWIPISEKLPENDNFYLVTEKSGRVCTYVFHKGNSEEYWKRCAFAWMPLPQPYKEVKQETVLDKIRAEIEEERVHDDWDFGQEIYYNNAIDNVLQIIDKYRNEVEKNEN